MSFVASASTITLTAYLTNKGRNFLISGVKSDIEATQFILGDSDMNYNLTLLLTSGNVPDLTGDGVNCVKSVSDDVDIKYKINVRE